MRKISTLLLIPFSSCIIYFFGVRPTPGPDLGRDFRIYQPTPWYWEQAVARNRSVVPVRSVHDFKPDLQGKVAIVTGSSSGIGRAVAKELFLRGCAVVITSRSRQRSEKAASDMVREVSERGVDQQSKARLVGVGFDLSDLEDVRKFVANFTEAFQRLDFLSTNAGMTALLAGWSGPWESPQKYEMLYAANYLGHFLLLQLLLPFLKKTPGARVVATSSIMHWQHDSDLDSLLPSRNKKRSDEHAWPWTKLNQYGNTKLLQVLMCFEMQRRIPEVPCVPVAPGLISTAIGNQKLQARDGVDQWIPVVSKSPFDGAQTTMHALLASEEEGKNNTAGVFLQPYYSPLHFGRPLFPFGAVLWEPFTQHLMWGLHKWVAHADAYNRTFAEILWKESMEACGLPN
ncbi:unnamed protein product [Amoebophrya sp. A120]|nr:unnamed protein product [Amoebophrya sp. A120]|eukprot:GSA120T00002069001.1